MVLRSSVATLTSSEKRTSSFNDQFLELLHQRSGRPKVGGIKAFGEPSVEGRKTLMGLRCSPPMNPESGQAQGRAELPGLRLLVLRECDHLLIVRFGSARPFGRFI